MTTSRHTQTTASHCNGILSLRGSGVPSPYLHMMDTSRVGPRRNISLIPTYMAVNRAVIRDLEDGGYPNWFVVPYFLDGTTGSVVASYGVQFSIAGALTRDDIITAAETAVQTYATLQGYTLPAGIIWTLATDAVINGLIAAAIPPAPSSYQTIVSQTGTAAPAVSGGLVPVNTYAGAPTFTWARTGTGVYTLTASSAVFNTSGKTGVSISASTSPLNNVSAVVTSSTVITFTSSSLNLLALGVSNADALMSKTMIYVQTYS